MKQLKNILLSKEILKKNFQSHSEASKKERNGKREE